jgi:hypothetical protein
MAVNARDARRLAIALACCALSAACTDDTAARMAALNHLVGQPEQTLLLTMGVPTRSYDAEGTKFLAYDERRVEFIPGVPGVGVWSAGAVPSQRIELWCETTFQVVQGVVRSFVLRGNACG